jgi:hypothetical protein
MRRVALIAQASFASFAVIAATLVACNDAGPPPADPTTVATTAPPPPVTTVVVDAGAATETPAPAPAPTVAEPTPPPAPAPTLPDGGVDLFACGGDSDCVAVPKAGCCPTGHLEAVNSKSVDAYKASVVCTGKGRHRLCPMYRVLDKRIAICASGSHKCEMAPPDKVTCSGTGPDVHACPTGATCDASGHCVVPATATPATATP